MCVGHSYPPGLCVCEEGQGLFKLQLLTAPFPKRLDDFVAQIISTNFDGIGSFEVIGLFVDFLTEFSHSILAQEEAMSMRVDILSSTVPYKCVY